MSQVSKEVRVTSLQSEIINRIKAIELHKADKKAAASGYNRLIKTLEEEKAILLQELESIQRAELTEMADEILEENDSELVRVG